MKWERGGTKTGAISYSVNRPALLSMGGVGGWVGSWEGERGWKSCPVMDQSLPQD